MESAVATAKPAAKNSDGVFAMGCVEVNDTGVLIPDCSISRTIKRFMMPEFSRSPDVDDVLGTIVPSAPAGFWISFGMHECFPDLIFATLASLDQGMWSPDTMAASRAIIGADIYVNAGQVEHLFLTNGVSGSRLTLADEDNSNYFPVINAGGEISFVDVHLPPFSGVLRRGTVYRVEVMSFAAAMKLRCEKGDRFFFRKPASRR